MLGIHGDWGSGKTSFMRQLQRKLGGKMPNDASVVDFNANGSPVKPEQYQPTQEEKQRQKEIITIWFDAWRYQNEPVPVVALLHEMRRQMAGWAALKKQSKKLGEITIRYLLNGLSDAANTISLEGIPSTEKIEKIGNDWETEHYAVDLASDTIRSHLQKTIQTLLPSKDARVVVFIDDLDRCNPKAAFRLLEGLKIYLSIPSCVFVLGMNERILVDAIRKEVSAPKDTPTEELRLRAAHYLEKICTDFYRLPLPTDTAVLLGQWIEKTEQRNALTAALGKTICLPPNPRRLKALANQWSRFASYVDFPQPDQPKAQEIWAVRVLIAAYIHQFHRDLWERWHFTPDFIREVKAWCNGEHNLDVEGKPKAPLKWTAGLKLTQNKQAEMWQTDFPNPGDIDIFWVDGLIRDYRDDLFPQDFIKLLQGKIAGSAL
ncbi:MAG: P-loop NTPase fold protein [Gallionella sp.]|nr:P-loop NTPase fold protein [Gallionella sp.]MDD4958790.1 P-loop NTPase fold protein [Gallionella sp.]